MPEKVTGTQGSWFVKVGEDKRCLPVIWTHYLVKGTRGLIYQTDWQDRPPDSRAASKRQKFRDHFSANKPEHKEIVLAQSRDANASTKSVVNYIRGCLVEVLEVEPEIKLKVVNPKTFEAA